MELFPNGGFVRLRSRARDKYVHADKDGIHVSLRPLGAAPSANAVWKVEHWPDVEGGDAFCLLQGAAYGRYLAVSNLDAPRGHRGVRALQCDYISPHPEPPFMWTPHRVRAGQNYARLHNAHRCLRANGRRRYWNNVVTVGARKGNRTTMMQWRVEPIPLSPVPTPLPPPPPPPPPIHVSRGLFKRRAEVQQPYQGLGRMIRLARLVDDANIYHANWPEFKFYGYSVSNLRTEVAARLDDENITLCVRAGMHALAVPLITDLPHNVDAMDIVVMTTGLQAFQMLEYPQFDAPEP